MAVKRPHTRPFQISRRDGALTVIRATSARAALRDFAAARGYQGRIDGLKSGEGRLTVDGVGLFRAASVARCECPPRGLRDVYVGGEDIVRCRTCLQPVENPPIVMSPAQTAAARSICVGGTCEHEAFVREFGESTVRSLDRLGVIEARAAGARVLVHLTRLGRDLVCVQNEIDADPALDPYSQGGTEMTDTADLTVAKPDPKPAKPPAKPRGQKKPPVDPPKPIENVTDVPPAAEPSREEKRGGYAPLGDKIVSEIAAAVEGSTVVGDPAVSYRRVKLGAKTVAMVKKPTANGIRVKVPKAEGDGYDLIAATSDDDLAKVLELVAVRKSHLTTRTDSAEPVAAAS